MLHSLERHLHLFVLLFLSIIHVCFGWNNVSMKDIGRAVENAQWLLLLQKQQCLVLERTGFGIFCRNEMSKMQTFWRSQHPPPNNLCPRAFSPPCAFLTFLLWPVDFGFLGPGGFKWQALATDTNSSNRSSKPTGIFLQLCQQAVSKLQATCLPYPCWPQFWIQTVPKLW